MPIFPLSERDLGRTSCPGVVQRRRGKAKTTGYGYQDIVNMEKSIGRKNMMIKGGNKKWKGRSKSGVHPPAFPLSTAMASQDGQSGKCK